MVISVDWCYPAYWNFVHLLQCAFQFFLFFSCFGGRNTLGVMKLRE